VNSFSALNWLVVTISTNNCLLNEDLWIFDIEQTVLAKLMRLSLSLEGDYDFTEPLIANWTRSCHSLHHLSLLCNRSCQAFSFLPTLENNARTLTSLDLQYCVISASSIVMITRVVCETIRKLTLASFEDPPPFEDDFDTYPHLDETMVVEFAKCKMLERLEISVSFHQGRSEGIGFVTVRRLWEKLIYEPQSKKLYTRNLSESFLLTFLSTYSVLEATFDAYSQVFDEVLLVLGDNNPDLHTVSFLHCCDFSYDSAVRIIGRSEVTAVRLVGCEEMLEDQDIRKIFCQAHKTNLKKIFVSIRHQCDVDDLLHIVEHNVDLEELHASFDLFVDYGDDEYILQVRDECCLELLKVRPELKLDFTLCMNIFV
jgi:hypothetical protein